MLAAFYYDGQSSRRHPVTLEIVDRTLRIRGATIQLDLPVGTVDFGEPWQKHRAASIPGEHAAKSRTLRK
ncbi:MAG: hypothetical protein IPO00_09580 [Betaproteobacteria bacterium]|nr:hypothetical protein [Betaproteobacteria bacterium]